MTNASDTSQHKEISEDSILTDFSNNQDRFKEVVEHANSIILRWNTAGLITYFNEFAQRFFGYSEAEIIGQHVMDTIVPSNESTGRDLRPLMNDICQNPTKYELNINENIKKNGDRVWVSWTNKVIVDKAGNPVGAFSIGSDITKQRELEEALRHAHKMQAIGQLAGGIAHDFNNLIQGILGFSEIIQQKTTQDDIGQYARHIEQTAQTAATLTAELLTFARKGKYQQKDFSVHAIIDDVLSILGCTIDRNISLQHQLEAPHYCVHGDDSLIKSALLNICLNAKDAMPSGGQITIASCNKQLEASTVNDFNLKGGNYLSITVSDTGSGMTNEVQQHIFEPFFTTKKFGKGSGMGLASVYGTVHLHSGVIFCTSQANIGTAFEILLPVLEKNIINPQHTIAATAPTIRILLIDDEEVVRDYSKTLFEHYGHRVETVANPTTAIELYRSSFNSFDLVILDMVMPEMDGKQLFNHLRIINPNIKALLSTGYSAEQELQDVFELGLLGFVQKPFTYDILEQHISRIFGADETTTRL
ncbi:Blue-light-activated protein [Sinobacterium norvegicum]|uniref:histidine kinase n=1 Tax=Sinobacterium norvegicum TaxID=1641715 RepID=A0ABM9AFL3_9GAMM|nr:PAS domain-containing sensor histidine kinase [Sinobacterium norvegicum]CAH0991993.1 Blue-light-activated protein [Sinobacterium norvegicum]